jgi:hypothetical protein
MSGNKSEADYLNQSKQQVNGFQSALGDEMGKVNERDEFSDFEDAN